MGELAKKIEMDMGRMENRFNRVKTISRRFRNQAKYKEGNVMEELKDKVMKVLRYNQTKKELSPEGFFDELAGGKDEIDEKTFVAWLADADKDVRDHKVSLRNAAKKEEKKEEKETKEAEKEEKEEADKEEEKEGEEKKEEEEKADEAEKKEDG